MIIIHENLFKEAYRISQSFRKVYGFNSEIIDRNLKDAFIKSKKFNGYLEANGIDDIVAEYNGKKILFITHRDIYFGDKSKNDDWIFGFSTYGGEYTVASTSRMKRNDNKPSKILEVSKEKYLKRLELLAIHEVGHDVVKAKHYKQATWVNNSGHELKLGPHCTDNTCVMYESVDIKSVPKEEGYMRLGHKKIYENGIEDLLEKINPDWFCKDCKSSIVIDKSYY